jgi:Tol biopolymer transport system component
MLTRQRAFAGASTVSILAKIIHTQPPVPPGMSSAIDPRLQEIVNRCLRKDRSRRLQSMGEVRVRLQEIIDEPVPAEPRPVAAPSPPVWKYAVSLAIIVVAAALLFRPRAIDLQTSLHRLTWDGGLTTYPSVSRDGTLLAYASDRFGRGDLDIWVERLGGGNPIRLTDDAADESEPDISPDGTRVAYRSERNGGGVYVVPSLGGTSRLVASDCHDPKYSPNGQWLACWTGAIGGQFYPRAARILLVPATGGPSHQFRPDFETAAFPLWMPDGSGMLFLGRKTGQDGKPLIDWWVAGENEHDGEHATGALKAFRDRGLLPVSGAYRIRPEAWLNGGAAVLFSALRDDASNVWNVGISTRGKMTSPPAPTTLGTGSDERPTAPARGDGPSLVFSRVDVEYQLRRVPLLATDAQPQPLLPGLSQVGSPTASADGRLLVYSERQPNGYRVVAVNPATVEERSVTTVESADFVRVLLSGDGKVVVYSGPGNVGYRMRIDEGQPESICAGCGWPTHVNFDGSAALFEALGDDERLLVWSNGGAKPLIGSADPKNRLQNAGRFSPNGRWVAFCAGARDGNAREIIVVPNAPGRPLRDDEWISISEGQTSDREPAWSPDGRRLFFISDRDGFRCIWARDIDPATGHPAGPPIAIAHFHHTRELLRGPMPSPGSIGLTATGGALIFTVARSTGNLWWQRATAR